jgi:hypothetical protein
MVAALKSNVTYVENCTFEAPSTWLLFHAPQSILLQINKMLKKINNKTGCRCDRIILTNKKLMKQLLSENRRTYMTHISKSRYIFCCAEDEFWSLPTASFLHPGRADERGSFFE